MGKFDDDMSLEDMSIYVEERADETELLLAKLRDALASRALDETILNKLANAAAALGEVAARVLEITDEAHDRLSETATAISSDEVNPPEENDIQENREHLKVLNYAYALTVYEAFARRSGYYSNQDLKEHFTLFEEDFTPDDIKHLMKLHPKLRRDLITRMEDAGERVIVLEDGVGRAKQYAIGFIQGRRDTSEKEPVKETNANNPISTEIVKCFPVINLIDERFPIESVSEDDKQGILVFVATIIDHTEQVVSTEMKQRVVDRMKNTRVDHQSAKTILDKIYQLRCIGKMDKQAKVYYVLNPEQRRAPRETRLTTSRQQPQEREAVDYIELGVANMFDALVEKVQHYEKKLTPREISEYIAEKGVHISEKDIKLLARRLDTYFVSGQASQSNGKSPHARSRGQRVFKIGLKSQGVKEKWKSDRNAVLAEIEQL